jgi:hypothetical protein
MGPATSRATEHSTRAFAEFGIDEIAYLRPVVMDFGSIFEIRAADGECLAVVADEQEAREALLRHDLEPHRLH